MTEKDKVSGRLYGRTDDGFGANYTVWGRTGVNGDGYAYEDPPRTEMNNRDWSGYQGTQVSEEERRWRDVRRKTLDRAEFHRRRGDTERANKMTSIAMSHDQGQSVEAKRKAKRIRLSGETGTLSPAAASDKRGAIDVQKSLPEDYEPFVSDWRTEIFEERKKKCKKGKEWSKSKGRCVRKKRRTVLDRARARRVGYVVRPLIGVIGGRGGHHHHDHEHDHEQDQPKGNGPSRNGGSSNGGGGSSGPTNGATSSGSGGDMAEGLVLRQSRRPVGFRRHPVQHGGDSGRLSPTNPPMGNGNTGLPNSRRSIEEMDASGSISVSDKTSSNARKSGALKFRRENKFKGYQARQSGQNNLRLGEHCGPCGGDGGGGGGMIAGDDGFSAEADGSGPVAGFDPVMELPKSKKKPFCAKCLSRRCKCGNKD